MTLLFPEPHIKSECPTHSLLCNLILDIFRCQNGTLRHKKNFTSCTKRNLVAEMEYFKYPLLLMRERYNYGPPSDFAISTDSLTNYQAFKRVPVSITKRLMLRLKMLPPFTSSTTDTLLNVYAALIDNLSTDNDVKHFDAKAG